MPDSKNKDDDEVASGLPPEFGTDEYEHDPKLEAERKKHRGTEDEIQRRREHILELKSAVASITVLQIQQHLKNNDFGDVDISTIYKDIKWVEGQAWPWADSMALTGFVSECRESAIRTKKMITTLYNSMNKESTNPRDQAALGKTINELQESLLAIKGSHATFAALHQANKKLIKHMSTAEEQQNATEQS